MKFSNQNCCDKKHSRWCLCIFKNPGSNLPVSASLPFRAQHCFGINHTLHCGLRAIRGTATTMSNNSWEILRNAFLISNYTIKQFNKKHECNQLSIKVFLSSTAGNLQHVQWTKLLEIISPDVTKHIAVGGTKTTHTSIQSWWKVANTHSNNEECCKTLLEIINTLYDIIITIISIINLMKWNQKK